MLFALTYANDKILIRATFHQVNNTGHNYITRLNAYGSLDSTFVADMGNEVDTFEILVSGKIMVGGNFITVNATGRSKIARLNSNGSLDTTFDPGAGAAGGAVFPLKTQPDGKVLIGGGFVTADGTPRVRIPRL